MAMFLMGVIHLFLLRFEAGDVYPPYSSLRSDPLGAKAFYQSLNNINHITAERNYRPVSKLETSQRVTFFYLGAKIFDSDSVQQELLKSFERIARSGGRLVIAFFPTMKNPLKPLGKENTSANTPKDSLTEEKDKCRPTEDQFVSLAERWGVTIGYDIAEEKNNNKIFKAESNVLALQTPAVMHTIKYFTDLSDSWKVVYATGDHAVLIERKFGKGTIVLSADSYFFSNEALRDQRHPELLAYFMGINSKAVFDETHLGIQQSYGVVYFVRKYRFHWFVAGIVLLAILFVWKNSVSFVQPPEDKNKENQESFASDRDYTQGLVSLLRKNIPKRNILKVCVEEWEKSISQGAMVNSDKLERIRAIVETREQRAKKNQHPVKGYKTIIEILSQGK
ncbi:MAG: DUF4350 domain-containing protein [Thermodesulfobacteriota bacterium]|nr:DUF4350 domain-containing protein [Thermodesulfobacteriota bacterium]